MGTVPGAAASPVQEKSAELPAWELCCQSCRMELALPGRPQARLSQPNLPKRCKLENLGFLCGTRKKREAGRQAERKDFGIFSSANCVSLDWFLPTLDPNFPLMT